MENGSMHERVRARVYELWESDGSPEGRAEEYWDKARTLVERENAGTARSSVDDKPSEV
jgi:hypothetical protein